MPTLFKNPNLVDYFVEHRGGGSLVEAYEAGKVISLPDLNPRIDHAFWAGLPVDDHPALKKLSSRGDDGGTALAAMLEAGDVPPDLASEIVRQSEDLLAQVLPAYERLFEGYEFTRRKIVWRLNTTMNEAMHIDTYKEANRDHFSRLFINLDDQPRIWKTSLTLDELYERYGTAAYDSLEKRSANQLHTKVKDLAFGETSREWWDGHPRHVIYFDPGDVWVVDSRQVAHQIFYGRRAVSIDYFVDRDSMQDASNQYLFKAKIFMRDHEKRMAKAAKVAAAAG